MYTLYICWSVLLPTRHLALSPCASDHFCLTWCHPLKFATLRHLTCCFFCLHMHVIQGTVTMVLAQVPDGSQQFGYYRIAVLSPHSTPSNTQASWQDAIAMSLRHSAATLRHNRRGRQSRCCACGHQQQFPAPINVSRRSCIALLTSVASWTRLEGSGQAAVDAEQVQLIYAQ